MKAKKLIAALCVALCALFSFAACTPTGSSDGGEGDEEYTLERGEGQKQITIYYQCSTGYEDRDIWFWYDGVGGRGYELHPCEYGAKFVANVPDTVTKIKFIIRTNCVPGSADWGGAGKDGTQSDRSVKLTGDYTVIYTKAGDGNNYTSNDGGKTLEVIKYLSLADMQDPTHVKITTSDNSTVAKENVQIKSGDSVAAISSVVNNVVTLSEPLNLSKAYTLSVVGYDDPVGIVPMTYFSSRAFESAYTYDGELGVTLEENSTLFRLWSPTASSVKLNLFNAGNGGEAYKTVDMTLGEKGVWTYTENANLNGKYYTYTVKNSLGEQEAVDPYARSAGLNGQRGMIIDLDETDPVGWDGTPFDNPAVENYTDAQIWEVHVRDFSNKITSSQYKGKYLAFTEKGLTENGIPVGVDYLKALGITHVHLLPSFDYASVDESKNGGFNWGYDPQNYNVPEGSYSTDPTDGAKRVTEYKQMVQALHDEGISVVMDVVYNHTYSIDSNLNKIVPYYYYRYSPEGTPSNGSGCGNETASERSMMRRYMVDSVKYWQEEYNLDGFRFDLMGVHDIETMQAIETAVHTRNPEALIYGEGWTAGTVEIAESEQAVLANLSKLNEGTSTQGKNGIAMFNDVIRDGLKGSVFSIDDTGFATGAKVDYLDKVLFGVTGSCATDFGNGNGWFATNPTQVINYASAHDNNTLWDRICHVYGEGADTLQQRLAMNRLTAAIVQTSLGVPFMQAGEEMLRQKKNADGSYNENSYNSSDEVNNLQWNLLTTTSEQYKMMQYYKGLMAFRKESTVLRQATAKSGRVDYVCELVKTIDDTAFVEFTMKNATTGEKLLIVYNAENKAVDYTLPAGSWDLYITGTQAGTTAIKTAQSGTQTAEAISCYVYKQA